MFRSTYASALAPVAANSAGPVSGASEQDNVSFAWRLIALLLLYVVSSMFWTMFFQNGFALTLWAEDCTSRPAGVTAEQFQVVNPLCIVLLSVGAAWFWRWLGARKREPSTPDKILFGLVAAIAACVIMVVASFSGGNQCVTGGTGVQVSMMWLVMTYVVVSLAEILVSPMGLSYCTKVAPKRLGGLVMGGWFASLAAGGYLSGFMGKELWESIPHSTYFGILAGLLVGVSVLLVAVRGVLRRAAE